MASSVALDVEQLTCWVRKPVTAAVLVSSLLAVVYVGRIIEIAWFREPVGDPPSLRKPAPSMITMTWLLVLMSLYFGVSPVLPAAFADGAAATLLGVAP